VTSGYGKDTFALLERGNCKDSDERAISTEVNLAGDEVRKSPLSPTLEVAPAVSMEGRVGEYDPLRWDATDEQKPGDASPSLSSLLSVFGRAKEEEPGS